MTKPPIPCAAGLGAALVALAALPALAGSESEPTRNPTLASEPGQLTAADYRRAERLLGANALELVYGAEVDPHWIGESDLFWYRNRFRDGFELVLVDAATGERRRAFDHQRLTTDGQERHGYATALSVEKEGYARGKATVEVLEGSPVSVEIALEPAEALSLIVRRADGRVPPMVQIALAEPEVPSARFRSYTPGGGGQVTLESFPTGTWELAVTAPDSLIVQQVVTFPGPPHEVILAAAGSLTIRVPELAGSETRASLELLGPDGQPLSITLAPGHTMSRIPFSSGTARLSKAPVGTWVAVVTTPDGDRWSGPVTVASGQPVEIVLR